MNRYNQAPHLTQDTTWESDNTLNIKNKNDTQKKPRIKTVDLNITGVFQHV